MLPAYYWHTSHTCKSSLIELHLYIWPLLGFLSFFIGGVKTQMIRSILSHLFKWREGSDYGVREKLLYPCITNCLRGHMSQTLSRHQGQLLLQVLCPRMLWLLNSRTHARCWKQLSKPPQRRKEEIKNVSIISDMIKEKR